MSYQSKQYTKQKPKDEAQKLHGIIRSKQRFGLKDEEINRIIHVIKNIHSQWGTKKKVHHQSRRVSIYEVKLHEFKYPIEVCYDSVRENIVTVVAIDDNVKFRISHYYDRFGNVVSLRNEFGVSNFRFDLNYDIINIDVTQVERNGTLYSFADRNLILNLNKETRELFEVLQEN